MLEQKHQRRKQEQERTETQTVIDSKLSEFMNEKRKNN
jgi:hypothetical protein